MTVESLKWRPNSSSFSRAVRASVNIFEAPLNPWFAETIAASCIPTLMCDLDIKKLNFKEREVYYSFFERAMYFNRHLDMLTSREQKGRQSLVFTEKFYNLPTEVRKLQEQGLGAGCCQEAVDSIENWFVLNRILNYTSSQLARNGVIDWDRFQVPEPQNASSDDWNDLSVEKELLSGIKEAFEDWKCGDPTEKAILFRAFSSVGFAQPLVTLLSQKMVNESSVDADISRRVGSMIMCTQITDDFSTASKDRLYGISGTVYSSLEDSTKVDKGIKISRQDTKRIVRIIRQIIGGCFDEIGIDPTSQVKNTIGRAGLLVLMGGGFLAMNRKYEGTNYPPAALTAAIANELITPVSRSEVKYRKATREAIEIALKKLMPAF